MDIAVIFLIMFILIGGPALIFNVFDDIPEKLCGKGRRRFMVFLNLITLVTVLYAMLFLVIPQSF